MSEHAKLNQIEYLSNFVRTFAQNNQHNVPKTMPGHISKILANDFVEFTFDMVGPYTLPKIKIPQSFSKYHREPTAVGDKGYAVPNSYNLGGESGDDGTTANSFPRGNLSSLVFHPISNKNWKERDPDMFLVTGGKSGHTTQSQDEKTSQVIDALNNIVHTASAGITHIAAEALSHGGDIINQVAQSLLTHSVVDGAFQLVAHKFVMGAPSSSTARSSDPTKPPQPDSNTVFTIKGDLHATGSISTPNGSVGPALPGPPGPQGPKGDPGAPIAGIVPAPVVGSRGGNVALASLLVALAQMGLIVNNTTP